MASSSLICWKRSMTKWTRMKRTNIQTSIRIRNTNQPSNVPTNRLQSCRWFSDGSQTSMSAEEVSTIAQRGRAAETSSEATHAIANQDSGATDKTPRNVKVWNSSDMIRRNMIWDDTTRHDTCQGEIVNCYDSFCGWLLISYKNLIDSNFQKLPLLSHFSEYSWKPCHNQSYLERRNSFNFLLKNLKESISLIWLGRAFQFVTAV